MNTLTRAASGVWSVTCLITAAILVGLFFYWVVLQRPYIELDEDNPVHEYRVTSGTILYVDNPLIPAEAVGRINYSATLVKDQFTRYALPSPDVASKSAVESADTVVRIGKPAAPLYAVFIPSYVQPGTYQYMVKASYRLNPFRTVTLDLPNLTITVE